MRHALLDVIAPLPPATRVWCGHEYTVSNLLFAQTVDAANPQVALKLEEARKERAAGRPTVPSTVGAELSFNPFMRVNDAAVKCAVGQPDDADELTMSKLRERKNAFKAPTL